MKTVMIAIFAVLFSGSALAQAETQTKSTKTTTTNFYSMKNGAMMYCKGTKEEPMKKDVTLKNGTKITTKGEVTMKDGKKTTLTNGQAIDVNGTMGDYDKMHANMKKM